MAKEKVNYQEVYDLYQLRSETKDLREFCADYGVNYDKFMNWQRHRLRIRRETPFQDTPYTWLPTMLTVKKLTIHRRIPSPMRMYILEIVILVRWMMYIFILKTDSLRKR